MDKLHAYMMIMTGLVLLFHLTGITATNPVSSALLGVLLSPEEIETSSYLVTYLIPALSLAVLAGGVIIAALTRDFRLMIKLSILSWLFYVGMEFLQVLTAFYMYGRIFAILAIILLSPFIVMYFMVVADWGTS